MEVNNTYELGDVVSVKVDIKDGYPLKDNKNITIQKGRIFGINIGYQGLPYDVLIKNNFYSHFEIIGLIEKPTPNKIFKNEIHPLSYYGLAKIQDKKTKEIFDINGSGENAIDIINIHTKELKEETIQNILKNYEYLFDFKKEIIST